MGKGTDVAMEELILYYEGVLSRRKPVHRGRSVNPVSSGSMPGHRGFYEGWLSRRHVPEQDSDPSGIAAKPALSPLVGQVTMNGVSFGKMRRISGSIIILDQDLST